MILKASQRGGAKQLGVHLMRDDENDHVKMHEIRGFLSNDVILALKEAHAVSQAGLAPIRWRGFHSVSAILAWNLIGDLQANAECLRIGL